MLLLFQFDGCPYCAKVCQYLNSNSINYHKIDSHKGSPSRDIVLALGGKEQVPFLVDIDNGIFMYESDNIIAYIKEHYLDTISNHSEQDEDTKTNTTPEEACPLK